MKGLLGRGRQDVTLIPDEKKWGWFSWNHPHFLFTKKPSRADGVAANAVLQLTTHTAMSLATCVSLAAIRPI